MRYENLADFLQNGKPALARGPVALLLIEDASEVDTTIRHHRQLGFRALVVFAAPDIALPSDLEAAVHRVDYDMHADGAMEIAVNAVNDAAADARLWLYYGYNAEYLFYPFCETRTIGEMLAFHTEERRDAMLSYVIDLYAGDLGRFPDAISLEDAHLDQSGYYALARNDAQKHPKERQLDFFGGLRWRFEEHIPPARRKIDRISIFRAQKGLHLRPDHTFNIEEYNTYACPWHHNITTAICSFRTAKALKRNPGSTFDIDTFSWRKSIEFQWHSQQLLDLGLMEPGQWF